MSWQAHGWVWALRGLAPNERLVALAMANYAGERGERIFPGITRLSDQTGLSESTVKRSIASLVDKKHLIPVKKGDGRGHASEYRMPVNMRLVADREEAIKGVQSEPLYEERGSNESRKGFTQSDKGVQGDLPNSHINIQEETFILPATRKKQSSHMTEKWVPTDVDLAFAASLGFEGERTLMEVGQFRDYWLGNGKSKVDWSATWRNWCRNAIKHQRPRSPGAAGAGHASGLFDVSQRRTDAIAAVAPPEAWESLCEKMTEWGNGEPGKLYPNYKGSIMHAEAREICDVTGISPTEPRRDWHVWMGWLDDGLATRSNGWEEYLITKLKEICSRPGYKPPGSLHYFTRALKEGWS